MQSAQPPCGTCRLLEPAATLDRLSGEQGFGQSLLLQPEGIVPLYLTSAKVESKRV